MFMMILEFIILLILSQLAFGLYLWLGVKDLYKYPNEYGTPIIGTLYNFYKNFMFWTLEDIYEFLTKIGKKHKAPFVFGHFLRRRGMAVLCPKLLEKIAYHPHLREKPKNMYNSYGAGEGLFHHCSIDEEFKDKRKEMVQSLKKSSIENSYHDTFVKAANSLVDDIKKNQETIDIKYHLCFTALNVLRESVYRLEFMPPDPDLYRNLTLLTDVGTNIFVNPLLTILMLALHPALGNIFIKKLDALLRELVSSSLEKLRNYDLNLYKDNNSYLLNAAIRWRKKQLPLSSLRSESVENIIAGSKTIHVVLLTAFTFLATLPEIQEKVWKEQFEIFGRSDRSVTPEDLKEMCYLDRFFKEVLRFSGPTVIAKYTTGEINVDGVTIPAGVSVVLPLRKFRMDPDYWNNPKLCDPDRFLEEGDLPKCCYLPFGLGIMNCPGMVYANHEMKVIVSTVIRKFKLSSSQKFEDIQFKSNLLDQIANPVPLRAEERF